MTLTCDMRRECANPVTHIGAKGYLYCATHAPQRQGVERCRQLRAWELELLRAGKPLPSYKPISQAEATLMQTTKDLKAAIGPRDGDYLNLRNAWAQVWIENDDGRYIVRGDCVRATFDTLGEALTHALQALARYQQGRAD